MQNPNDPKTVVSSWDQVYRENRRQEDSIAVRVLNDLGYDTFMAQDLVEELRDKGYKIVPEFTSKEKYWSPHKH